MSTIYITYTYNGNAWPEVLAQLPQYPDLTLTTLGYNVVTVQESEIQGLPSSELLAFQENRAAMYGFHVSDAGNVENSLTRVHALFLAISRERDKLEGTSYTFHRLERALRSGKVLTVSDENGSASLAYKEPDYCLKNDGFNANPSFTFYAPKLENALVRFLFELDLIDHNDLSQGEE